MGSGFNTQAPRELSQATLFQVHLWHGGSLGGALEDPGLKMCINNILILMQTPWGGTLLEPGLEKSSYYCCYHRYAGSLGGTLLDPRDSPADCSFEPRLLVVPAPLLHGRTGRGTGP